MKFLTTHASMYNTMTFSRHWLKRLVRVLSTEQLIMAKGTKAASGSRGSARPGPGVGGVMKKPAGARRDGNPPLCLTLDALLNELAIGRTPKQNGRLFSCSTRDST